MIETSSLLSFGISAFHSYASLCLCHLHFCFPLCSSSCFFFLFYPSFPFFILSPSYLKLISLILFHSFPVGKWGAARVHVWTGTRIGAVALLGLNSLAPVAMWTFSHLLPRQHQLPCSPPSNSIRKMGKALLNASSAGEVHSRDRQHVKY